MQGLGRRGFLIGAGLALPASRALAAMPAWAAGGDDAVLRDVIDNGARNPADRARDVYRHPYASLIFWGLKPGMTVLDNLLLGAVTRHDKAEVRASVDEACVLFPTLHRRQADRAGLLSGGEQQMLAIARALMAKPRMLLLDEPSAGLSPRIIGEMVDALRALHQRGLAMLLVEQNVGLAGALASTAYVLANGAIAFETDGASLASNPQIIRSYLGQ